MDDAPTTKPRITAGLWGLERVQGRGDVEIARIAERQRGLVHRRQLIEAGITGNAIKHRLRTKRLHALFRDVYVVGRPRLEPWAAEMAAVMHFDGRGVLSHRTAGVLWGLSEDDNPALEITVVGIDARSRPGLTVHRRTVLAAGDVRLTQNLAVTAVARTLLDLAGVLDVHELEAAYAIALRRKLTTPDQILAAIGRAPCSPGVSRLRVLIGQGSKPTLTRSRYERALLRLIRAADLSVPIVNTKVKDHEVDMLWPEQKLIVEFDGFGFHGHRTAFETDRLRDQRLVAAGYRVLRITARQLDHTPYAVIARLAAALAV